MIPKINNKLEELLEYYPGERVTVLRQEMDAFWSEAQPGKILFTLRRRDVKAGLNHNNYELSAFSNEQALLAQLEDRLLKAELQDYYIPSLIPGNSPYYLSIAFGAKWEKLDQGALAAHPIINTADEIDKLAIPDFDSVPESPFTRCIERIEYFLENTGGKIPLILPDPQGPMSLASQLWNQEEMFISMISDPDSVHRIMRLATKAVIEFFRYVFNRFGRKHFLTVHCTPYLYRKEGEGIPLSEDMIGVLSPSQLEEFLVPYLNEIYEKFGDIVVHSCGDCSKKMAVINKIRGLSGLHLGQTDVSLLKAEEVGSLCLLSPADWASRKQIADYVQVLKRNLLKGWIQVHTIEGEIDQEAGNVGIEQLKDAVNFLKRITCA